MSAVSYKLIIGNRNYSSWSLRVWMYVRESGLMDQVEITRVPIYVENYKQKLLEYSPSGRCPVLVVNNNDGGNSSFSVWDSLAIIEYLREQHEASPTGSVVVGWPSAPDARGMARSIACEFHAGFLAIRDELPQNLRRVTPEAMKISDTCRQQIQRVDEIWSTCYAQNDAGPWLFGPTLTIADIVYVPVALRFVTYGIKVSPAAQRFVDAVRALPSVQEWIELAKEEPETLDFIDQLIPAAQSPLIL